MVVPFSVTTAGIIVLFRQLHPKLSDPQRFYHMWFKVLCGNDSVEGILWDNSVTRLLIRGKWEKQGITDMCQHSLKFGRGIHDLYGTTKGDNRVS